MEQLPRGGFLPLNVWSTTLASALTALIIAILSLPLHLMHAGHGMGPRGGMGMHGMGPQGAPNPGMIFVWVLIWLLVVFVYGGVAGAIFGALYNAILNRRTLP
ncbi:MAG TPA: hypothetical protein VJP76_02900 [Candidatus Tumulicola sp.]|nr:hypothetical protein [Candidatus Tumulicola sp.]